MVRRRYSESALNRRAALFESRPRRRFREEDEINDDEMDIEDEDEMDIEDEGTNETINVELTEDEYKALLKFAKKAKEVGFSEADIDLEEARRRRRNARAVLEAVRRARRYREDRELSMDARKRREMLERRSAARKRMAEMRRSGRR